MRLNYQALKTTVYSIVILIGFVSWCWCVLMYCNCNQAEVCLVYCYCIVCDPYHSLNPVRVRDRVCARLVLTGLVCQSPDQLISQHRVNIAVVCVVIIIVEDAIVIVLMPWWHHHAIHDFCHRISSSQHYNSIIIIASHSE